MILFRCKSATGYGVITSCTGSLPETGLLLRVHVDTGENLTVTPTQWSFAFRRFIFCPERPLNARLPSSFHTSSSFSENARFHSRLPAYLMFANRKYHEGMSAGQYRQACVTRKMSTVVNVARAPSPITRPNVCSRNCFWD